MMAATSTGSNLPQAWSQQQQGTVTAAGDGRRGPIQSGLEGSPLPEAEALVALFQQVEHHHGAAPAGAAVDVGTSTTPPPSASFLSGITQQHASSSSSSQTQSSSNLHKEAQKQQQQEEQQPPSSSRRSPSAPLIIHHSISISTPMPAQATATPEEQAEPPLEGRVVLSDKISGTGTFFLQRDETCVGDNLPKPGQFEGLSAELKEERVKYAYIAIEAICKSLVPGESMDLLDALMETTEVHRSRHESKKVLPYEEEAAFRKGLLDDFQEHEGQPKRGPSSAAAQQELNNLTSKDLVYITQPMRGIGIVCLRKDKNTRKRRSEFVCLARSQRARVIKTAYEVAKALTDIICPGECFPLLDKVFALHDTIRSRIHKRTSAALSAYPDPAIGAHLAHAAAMLANVPPHQQQQLQQLSRKGQQPGGKKNRKRPSPHGSGGLGLHPQSSSANSSHDGSSTMWLGTDMDDDDSSHSSGGPSKHYKSDGSGGSPFSSQHNPYTAQMLAAQWTALAGGMSPVFLPAASQHPGATGGPAGVSYNNAIYQHHMMMAASAAAGSPFFYPGAMPPSLHPSSSSGTPSSSTWPQSEGGGDKAATGAGNVYAGALDDNSSTMSRGTPPHGDDSASMDGGESNGGSAARTGAVALHCITSV